MSEKRTDDERRGIILLSFEMPKGHMKKMVILIFLVIETCCEIND